MSVLIFYVQGYRIKTLSSCHESIATQLQPYLEMNETPDWLTTGKTVLIMKDRENWNHMRASYVKDILEKARDGCQRNKTGAKENRGGKGPIIN